MSVIRIGRGGGASQAAWWSLLKSKSDDAPSVPLTLSVPLAFPPLQTPKLLSVTNTTAPRPPTHIAMSASPPPEEREKAEAEARAKEQAEQAALPYKWDQTIKDLDITITIEGKYKGKDLDIKIARSSLKAGIKGQEPFIDVRSATQIHV